MISNEAKKEIDFWVSKYPEGRKSSAVMQALTIVQKENGGSLNPDLINEVADYLEMPVISVQEVATFYENYNHKPVGRHVVRFCHNISCMLNGSDALISYLADKLTLIQVGEGRLSPPITTGPPKKFSPSGITVRPVVVLKPSKTIIGQF